MARTVGTDLVAALRSLKVSESTLNRWRAWLLREVGSVAGLLEFTREPLALKVDRVNTREA